jgi:hypothetical protein
VIVRLLFALAVVVAVGTPALAAQPEPKPLQGVPLTGKTGLRLLVADNPPFILDVDTGRVTAVKGTNARRSDVLSVRAAGRDAVLWLDRRAAPTTRSPEAEIYVVRQGTTRAVRIAKGWELALDADDRTLWLKAYTRPRRCILRAVALNGRERRSPRAVPCSSRLVDAGGVRCSFKDVRSSIRVLGGHCSLAVGCGRCPARPRSSSAGSGVHSP